MKRHHNYTLGREHERNQILEFLRGMPSNPPGLLATLIVAIEKGEHVPEDAFPAAQPYKAEALGMAEAVSVLIDVMGALVEHAALTNVDSAGQRDWMKQQVDRLKVR